jgi:type I restriction enzyme R subunit
LGGRTKSHYKSSHSRDKLESYIGDYNTCMARVTRRIVNRFKIFQSISKRLKIEKESFNNEKDRLDIVIVVNMMLTGFDAKKVNTVCR